MTFFTNCHASLIIIHTLYTYAGPIFEFLGVDDFFNEEGLQKSAQSKIRNHGKLGSALNPWFLL